jgi:pimeloyl-ACP methyl ester carboxylesterase
MISLPQLPAAMKLSVLFGAKDRVIQPAWHIDHLRDLHPAPAVEVLEGVGHLPHHVAPETARKMLHALVRETAIEPTAARALRVA